MADAERDQRATQLREHIARLVADWPPLTETQIDILRDLLPPPPAPEGAGEADG